MRKIKDSAPSPLSISPAVERLKRLKTWKVDDSPVAFASKSASPELHHRRDALIRRLREQAGGFGGLRPSRMERLPPDGRRTGRPVPRKSPRRYRALPGRRTGGCSKGKPLDGLAKLLGNG